MIFDTEDRAEMLESLGDSATLPSGEEIQILLSENVSAVAEVDGSGDIGRVYPSGLISSDDSLLHALVDGEEGTIITVLNIQYRIMAITAYSDGFSDCLLMGL